MDLGDGGQGQILYSHVAYQIKGNDTYSNMIANILPGIGVKRSKHFFLKVVMLHIKLEGREHRAPCNQIVCPFTQPRPLADLGSITLKK